MLMINEIVSKLKVDIKNDKQLKLISALKLLSVNPSTNGESITKEYLEMISNEDELKRQESLCPSRMQRLQGMTIKVCSMIFIIYN